MTSGRTATLIGKRRTPALRLEFDRGARVPFGVKLPTYPPPRRRPGQKGRRPGRPSTLQDWVRMVPGRRWDADANAWIVTDPGPDADRVLRDLGFDLDLSHGASAGVRSLADLATPWIEVDPDDEWVTWVYLRFSGLSEKVPAGSFWDKDGQCWLVHTPDMRFADPAFGTPRSVVDLGERLVAGIRRGDRGTERVENWATQLARLPRAPRRVPSGMPPVPTLGEFEPFGFQVAGAYALLGGHFFLADAPGVGKTLTSVLAHKMAATRRLLVVAPPVALTGWARHVVGADLADAEHVATVVPTRKVPAFPASGVLIVADSTLAARPALVDEVLTWAPDGLVVDESHRLKTWEAARSRVVRRIAQRVSGLRIAATGTGMLSTPVELANQLAITGQLDSVFGGLAAFLTTYARPDPYGGWLPRAKALPMLRQVLDSQVWVRRMPADVYNRDGGGPAMPPVLPPRVRYVDVDLRPYRDALAKQQAVIDQWLDDLGRPATDDDIADFCAQAIGFISPLRKAAAMAKVPAACDIVTDWVRDEAAAERPLLVWVHHQEVMDAVRAALQTTGAETAFIDGSISAAARGQIEADFQSGRYLALVLSLQAAGVALTLTRSADHVFVESDWTPAVLTQARDRTARIGQTRATTLTTLVAPGTLDEHLQRVQRTKAAHLDVVMGDGNDTSVVATATDDLATPRQIVETMVRERIAARGGVGTRRAA